MTTFTEIRSDTFVPEERIMPRKSATSTATMPELERQLEADTAAGLEELPDFSLADGTPVTADELLAVDKPQPNGTYVADPDGFNVRPSEQCRTPSPLGIGCTRREFHSGGHSWSPQPLDQATLPGTPAPETPAAPEPEPTDFDIPFEAQFQKRDFKSAPGLKAIAGRLIAETEEFSHLVDVEIRYFWKRRGGLKGGNRRFGNLTRPTGLAAYALGAPVYALWLAADHVRDAKLTEDQFTATVFDLLAHSAVDPDDHSAYRVMGPDFEGMALTLRKYGLFTLDLREAAASLRQLPLEDELALPDGDDEDPVHGAEVSGDGEGED